MRPPLPLDARLVHQLHVGLVHQAGGEHGVAVALAAQLAAGEAPELAVDRRQQAVEGPAIAALDRHQEPGYLARGDSWILVILRAHEASLIRDPT